MRRQRGSTHSLFFFFSFFFLLPRDSIGQSESVPCGLLGFAAYEIGSTQFELSEDVFELTFFSPAFSLLSALFSNVWLQTTFSQKTASNSVEVALWVDSCTKMHCIDR